MREKQINERLNIIEAELRTATESEKIEELATEIKALIEERGRLVGEAKRKAQEILDGSAESTEMEVPGAEKRSFAPKLDSKRKVLSAVIGKQARGKKLGDVEKRALETSLTTTATEFIKATESIDGVNNAGIFIPTKLLFDLLKEEGKLSPIMADVNWTNIPGYTDFPYRAERTKAQAKKEGESTPDGQMKWEKLTLAKGYLQIIMAVTDEVQALTDFELGAYLLDQLLQDLGEDWSEDIIYGTGTNEHIKGITVGATAVTYATGKATEGLVEAIKKTTGKFRRGAKAYLAQDVYDDIYFSVDSNGNFKYPLINNATGISGFGTAKVEVDENLKEGEFIVGNVSKYFKANSLLPIRVETERKATRGVTYYVANEFCATAPFPKAFVHGKKA